MEGRSDKSIVSTLHCLKNSNHCVVIQENVLVHRKYTFKYLGVKGIQLTLKWFRKKKYTQMHKERGREHAKYKTNGQNVNNA